MTVIMATNGVAHAQSTSDALSADPAFAAAKGFAELMIVHGRDDYGEKKLPLFATQLNVNTRRIPAGTEEDPGVWNTHFEVAGYQPYCQNLISDFGLIDLLLTLSRATGDAKYDDAGKTYLRCVLDQTRDPRSGYIPWGEHVGYDMVKDAVHVGLRKYWHEAKSYLPPWDLFWELNPDATRHEIETAFYNHLCDRETFAFNRHATMNGKPNTGSAPCSLLSSAGLYIDAWCWLHKKTGEAKFLEWAHKMNGMASARRSKETGLIPTDESTRKELMAYAEAAGYAPYLFIAADTLGEPEGAALRQEALDYMLAFDRYAYTAKRDDTGRPGYFDAINTTTGEPVSVDNVRYLEAWQWKDNHQHVGVIVSAMAIGCALTGDARLQAMFDRALSAMDVPRAIESGSPLQSSDAAGVINSLVAVAKKSGDTKYLDAAAPLVAHVLKANMKNGFFTSGRADGENYYCARAGSGTLAESVMAFALAKHGRWNLIPPIRDIEGGLRF